MRKIVIVLAVVCVSLFTLSCTGNKTEETLKNDSIAKADSIAKCDTVKVDTLKVDTLKVVDTVKLVK